MIDPLEPLLLDLLEWLRSKRRPYSEVIEAWRTSCPRLPVWEEVNTRGFVEKHHEMGREAYVAVSPAGLAYVEAHRFGGARSPEAPPRASAAH